MNRRSIVKWVHSTYVASHAKYPGRHRKEVDGGTVKGSCYSNQHQYVLHQRLLMFAPAQRIIRLFVVVRKGAAQIDMRGKRDDKRI